MKPPLVQIMACRLFGTKPSSEPMLQNKYVIIICWFFRQLGYVISKRKHNDEAAGNVMRYSTCKEGFLHDDVYMNGKSYNLYALTTAAQHVGGLYPWYSSRSNKSIPILLTSPL